MNIKNKLLLVFLTMMLSIISVSFASENISVIQNKEVKVTYNGNIQEFQNVNGEIVYPISYEGTTYLPIRSISTLFKSAIKWDGVTNRVYLGEGEIDTTSSRTVNNFIAGENTEITAILNQDVKIYYNKKEQTFTDVNGKVVYPISYNGTTYLPVRAVSNLFGLEIDWDGKNNTVIIKEKNTQTGGSSSNNESTIASLQVGDYVSYTPDIEARDYLGEVASWRVWEIEGDNIIIVPTEPLGKLALEGAEDWLNAEEKIEDECDKYINKSLGITAEEIRSMKIEDIEEVMPEEEVTQAKQEYDYGKEYSYESGTFYAEKADEDTFDGYNKALSGGKSASSSSQVTLVNTAWYKNSPTWNKLGNTKSGMANDNYGTILGNTWGWLASRYVYCGSGNADFNVRYVFSGRVYSTYLCNSDGGTVSYSCGVRPLVSLSSTLFAGGGAGTSSNPWQLAKR